ncbi:MAG: (d)CMP kinase [Clostridia bacterium]|nr:(d)CMP kinase [Clostridia bacterium]
MIRIAIDGPGGAGKSSVAKAVSKALGIIYVDTGAMYRNIGVYMLDHSIDTSDSNAVTAALENIKLELKFENGKQVILLNGVDRGEEIRTPAASMAASAVSAIPAVRNFLLDMQRNTARKNSVIMDGRDIGTVILPDAELKIFLTASAKARAERRYNELVAKGSNVTFEQVYNEMVERDKNDSTRDVAPCVKAKDAVLLDNSKLTEAETVETILKLVRKKTKDTTPLYSFLKVIVTPIYRLLFNVHVKGKENVPKAGGVLLCPNHIGAIDVISIAVVCPRQLTFIAKKELFSIPVLGWLIKALGAVKIDRGGSDVGAIKTAVSTIQNGRTVSIFPQGHRFPGVNPATTPIRHGAGLIAYHAKCDVVPVCIQLKKGKYSLFRRTDIIYGKPIKYSELGFSEGGRDEYAKATDMIFESIVSLGDFSSLPDYDPALEKQKKRKKRK